MMSLYKNEADKQAYQEQLDLNIQQAQRLEAENLQLCDEIDQLQVSPQIDTEQLTSLRANTEKLRTENASLLEKLRYLESEHTITIEKFSEDNTSLRKQLRELETYRHENQIMLETVQRQVADLEAMNRNLAEQAKERELSAPILDSGDLQITRGQILELEKTNAALHAKLSEAEAHYQTNQTRLADALAQIANLEKDNTALYHRLSEMEVLNENDKSRVNGAMMVVNQLEKDNVALQEQVDSLETKYAESQTQFQKTIEGLEQRNTELQARIHQLETYVPTTATPVAHPVVIETPNVTEPIKQIREQVDLQARQMEAMTLALQYHRAELAQLRQEMRAVQETKASVKTESVPRSGEDEIYLSLTRTRLEVEEKQRQSRSVLP
jgi:chromosome segregation ATPase